jgi:hypothetical protein
MDALVAGAQRSVIAVASKLYSTVDLATLSTATGLPADEVATTALNFLESSGLSGERTGDTIKVTPKPPKIEISTLASQIEERIEKVSAAV